MSLIDDRWRALLSPMSDRDRQTRVVLGREPACRMCGQPATVVDHIVPVRLGGNDTTANLQPLCETCHGEKSAGEKPPPEDVPAP